MLKWSLSQTDGTKPSEIPSLNDEQRKWLDEVFKSLTIDEVSEMRNIVLKLEKIIIDHQQTEQCLELFDQLMELICGLDNAKNFCKIGGVFAMFDNACNKGIDPVLRSKCYTIITECTQNNHFVQDALSKIPFWTIMETIEEKGTNTELKSRALGALSAILKGNNLVNKRLFLNNSGLEFVLKMIILNAKDEKIVAKLLSLLSDLLAFDKFLHLDLIRVEDENANINKIAEDKELSHFKNFCISREKEITSIFKALSKRILEDPCLKKSHLRYSYFSGLRHHLTNLKAAGKLDRMSWMQLKKEMLIFLSTLEDLLNSEDFYSMEVSKVKDIISVLN